MLTLWMISYDISNDKTRRKVHNHLKDHGNRVQYSVFECRLRAEQFTELREELANLIEDTDTIRWYPLCNTCENKIDWQGNGSLVDPNDYYIV